MNLPMPPRLSAIDTPGLLYRYEEDGTPQDWPGHVDFHIHPHLGTVEVATFGVTPMVPAEVLEWVAAMARWLKDVDRRQS